MRKGSPACRVKLGCPWICICTVPARMYPTSSPGCMCQPDSTPAGISVITCTISRPGIDDSLCWSSVRFSFPGRSSRGFSLLVVSDDIGRPLGGRELGGFAQEGQQLAVELLGVRHAHHVRAA